jgi:hypothetical protein
MADDIADFVRREPGIDAYVSPSISEAGAGTALSAFAHPSSLSISHMLAF